MGRVQWCLKAFQLALVAAAAGLHITKDMAAAFFFSAYLSPLLCSGALLAIFFMAVLLICLQHYDCVFSYGDVLSYSGGNSLLILSSTEQSRIRDCSVETDDFTKEGQGSSSPSLHDKVGTAIRCEKRKGSLQLHAE